MLLSEKGLTRALKDAYKGSGYTINNTEEQVQIYTGRWYIRATWDKFPVKALATIVEHMGQLPTEEGAWNLSKAGDPQSVMQTKVGEDVARWELGNDQEPGVQVMVVPVTFGGMQVLQARMKGYDCYGVHTADLGIVNHGERPETAALARGNDIVYKESGEDDVLVVLQGVRPSACPEDGNNDWAGDAWVALEQVALSAERARLG